MSLKELRESTGLSLEEAAKYLGFPVKTWKKWEEETEKPNPFIEKIIVDRLNERKRGL